MPPLCVYCCPYYDIPNCSLSHAAVMIFMCLTTKYEFNLTMLIVIYIYSNEESFCAGCGIYPISGQEHVETHGATGYHIYDHPFWNIFEWYCVPHGADYFRDGHKALFYLWHLIIFRNHVQFDIYWCEINL